MALIERVRRRWRDFRSAPPGARFQRHHDRERRAGRGLLARLALGGSGSALAVVGVALMPAPGPGLLVFALGAALLAGQSATVARGLDRLEVAVRQRWQLWRARRQPPPT